MEEDNMSNYHTGKLFINGTKNVKCAYCGEQISEEDVFRVSCRDMNSKSGGEKTGRAILANLCGKCYIDYISLRETVGTYFLQGHDVKITPIYRVPDLAQKCICARENLGWSQEKLANKAGISRWTVINFEHGSNKANPDTVECIVKALGVEV